VGQNSWFVVSGRSFDMKSPCTQQRGKIDLNKFGQPSKEKSKPSLSSLPCIFFFCLLHFFPFFTLQHVVRQDGEIRWPFKKNNNNTLQHFYSSAGIGIISIHVGYKYITRLIMMYNNKSTLYLCSSVFKHKGRGKADYMAIKAQQSKESKILNWKA
jgi:hypothetical protein